MNEETNSAWPTGIAPSPSWTSRRLEGRYFYAVGAGLLAIIWLRSGDFINVWQPVSDAIPARTLLVQICAVAMLCSAAGLLVPRAARVAALIPTLLYLLFVWGWITRILLLPKEFGTWSGCAEEIVLVIAGALLLTTPPGGSAPSNVLVVCRVLFGLCAISFGIIHFDALAQTAQMVPRWLPGTGKFWAMFTGVCHGAGGIALILNFRARFAAYLLAAMYFMFELLVWIPLAWPIHFDPVVWGGNAITIAIAASAWVLGDALGQDRELRKTLSNRTLPFRTRNTRKM